MAGKVLLDFQEHWLHVCLLNKFCLEIDTVNKLIYLSIAFVWDMTSSFLFTLYMFPWKGVEENVFIYMCIIIFVVNFSLACLV